MRFRKLRIAWSVLWGLLALLLVVLWVRSYRWEDQVFHPIGARSLFFCSINGQLMIGIPGQADWSTAYATGWTGWSYDLEQIGPVPYRGFELTGYGYIAPYWFHVLIVAAIAVTSWIHWRFNLRTLLIATTLVAVVLGLVAWSMR
jgi:hypothetical protein